MIEDLRRNAVLYQLPFVGSPSNFFTKAREDGTNSKLVIHKYESRINEGFADFVRQISGVVS